MRDTRNVLSPLRIMFSEAPDVHCYQHVKALLERDLFQVSCPDWGHDVYAFWQVRLFTCPLVYIPKTE